MSRTVTLNYVSDSEVPRITAEYEQVGATVSVTPDGPATSRIVAVWPDMDAVGAQQAHIAAAQAHAAAATAHASAATAVVAALRAD